MAMKPVNNSNRVYVGNLVTSTTKEELHERFSPYGDVKHVWVAHNPPGFAFVEYFTQKGAENSIRNLDGAFFNGNKIRVQHSHAGGRNQSYQRRPSEDYMNNNKPNQMRQQRNNFQRSDFQRYRSQSQRRVQPQGNLRQRGELRHRLGSSRGPDPQLRYDDWDYDEMDQPYYDDPEDDYLPPKRPKMMKSRPTRLPRYDNGPPSPNGNESPLSHGLPPRGWKPMGSPEPGYRPRDVNSPIRTNPPLRRAVYTTEQMIKSRKRLAPRSNSAGLSPHSSTDRGNIIHSRRNVEDLPVQRIRKPKYVDDYDREWSPVPLRRHYSPGPPLKRKKVPLSNSGSLTRHSPGPYDVYPSGGGHFSESFESDDSYDAPPKRKGSCSASIKSGHTRPFSDCSQYPKQGKVLHKRQPSPECVMCTSGAPKPRFTRPPSPMDLPPIKTKRKGKASLMSASSSASNKKRLIHSPCRSEASSAYSSCHSFHTRSQRSVSPRRIQKKRPMTPPIYSRSPSPIPINYRKKSKALTKVKREISPEIENPAYMSPPFSRDREPYTPSPVRSLSPEPIKKKQSSRLSPFHNAQTSKKLQNKMPKQHFEKELSPLPPMKMKNRKLPRGYSDYSPERNNLPKMDKKISAVTRVKKIRKIRSPSRSPSPMPKMSKKTKNKIKHIRKVRTPSISGESMNDSYYSGSESNLSPHEEIPPLAPPPQPRKKKSKKLSKQTDSGQIAPKSRSLKKRRKSWSSDSGD